MKYAPTPKREKSGPAKSFRAKAREERALARRGLVNDLSVYVAASAGSILRKLLPDAAAGGETLAPLTWGAALSALGVGGLVVALREWGGKPNHAKRREKIRKRLIESAVIGYFGVDLLKELIGAIGGSL